MQKKLLKFKCPNNYDLYMVCHTHGWKNLTPFDWDDRNSRLSFAVYLDSASIDVSVIQRNDWIEVLISSNSKINKTLQERLKAVIIRSLALEVDTTELFLQAERVGSEYAALIKQGAGRLLRAPSLWEDAAKTLFTTNCSWALTKKMCATACSGKFVRQTPSGKFPFPSPGTFNNITASEIRKFIPLGYRANYFLHLAKMFSKNSNLGGVETNGFSFEKAKKIIEKLQGFGPYATAHLLVMAGYYNEIPVDTVVLSYLKRVHNVRKPNSFIKRHYGKWGPYKWWGIKLEKMLNQQNWLGN